MDSLSVREKAIMLCDNMEIQEILQSYFLKEISTDRLDFVKQ